VVSETFLDDANFERLFTPERLAHIDQAMAEIEVETSSQRSKPQWNWPSEGPSGFKTTPAKRHTI
jgi:hypothetical protein